MGIERDGVCVFIFQGETSEGNIFWCIRCGTIKTRLKDGSALYVTPNRHEACHNHGEVED